jgi:hypothetical protein
MKSTNPRYITNLTKDLTLIYVEDKSGLPELTDMSLWFKNNIKDLSKVTKIEEFPNDKRKVFDNTIYASSLNGLFSDCKLFSNQTVDSIISKINIKYLSDKNAFINTFAGLEIITKLNLTVWDFSNLEIKNMKNMFYGCKNLKELKGIKNLVNSKTVDVNTMFADCSSLEEIDISDWDTSGVEDFSRMFDGCFNLKKITGIIDMKSCKQYAGMFGVNQGTGCKNLKGLKIKNPPNGFFLSGLDKTQYEII